MSRERAPRSTRRERNVQLYEVRGAHLGETLQAGQGPFVITQVNRATRVASRTTGKWSKEVAPSNVVGRAESVAGVSWRCGRARRSGHARHAAVLVHARRPVGLGG